MIDSATPVQLVIKAQAGDKLAFGNLFILYRKMVIVRLREVGLNRNDAEDECHEIFLHVRETIGAT